MNIVFYLIDEMEYVSGTGTIGNPYIITNNNIQRTESNYQGDDYELNFYRNGEEIRRSYIA